MDGSSSGGLNLKAVKSCNWNHEIFPQIIMVSGHERACDKTFYLNSSMIKTSPRKIIIKIVCRARSFFQLKLSIIIH